MRQTDNNDFPMVAKTLTGLEELLAGELTNLGAANVRVQRRAVTFTGDLRLLYAANIYSRLATRILVPLHEFRARDRDELYRGVRSVAWPEHLDRDGSFAVDVVMHNSRFKNSHYVAQRSKDAVVDALRDKAGRRPSVDLQQPDLRLSLYLNGTQATLALDASGEPLHKRGYRRRTGEAPINEVLAAGITAISEWDGSVPLVDPMCGSGTLLIEAVLRARQVAPGLVRKHYSFMKWKNFRPAVLDGLLSQAGEQVQPSPAAPVTGIDRDPASIRAAQENARRAGVGDDLEFRCMAMEDFSPPAGPGTVITNPPYGERLKMENLRELYSSLGDAFKQRYTGYTAHVFTANLDAAKSIGLRSSRRTILYNGPLEGRLLRYDLYAGSRKGKERR